MTDRELLELAAKAAGMEVTFYPDGICRDVTGFHPAQNIFAAKIWNPIGDDGDACSLLVKMGFQDGVIFQGDPEKTRRAIVEAAAEIGRNMK